LNTKKREFDWKGIAGRNGKIAKLGDGINEEQECGLNDQLEQLRINLLDAFKF
jgi:hypothetical protein